MSTQHILTCPVCHTSLLVEHADSIGGSVGSNVVLIDYAKETARAAAARKVLEDATSKMEAADAAVAKATTDNEAAQAAATADTPPDDAKVAAAQKTAADLATAVEAQTAAQAVVDQAAADYEVARKTPPPPPVGFLSPDGNWEWDGAKWAEVTPKPPPLPPGVDLPVEAPAAAPAQVPAEVVTTDA
jgi:hypothetical protein